MATYSGDGANTGVDQRRAVANRQRQDGHDDERREHANPSLVGVNVTFTASVTGTAPTGTLSFTDGGATIAGCGAVALTGSGNTRTAACSSAAPERGNAHHRRLVRGRRFEHGIEQLHSHASRE